MLNKPSFSHAGVPKAILGALLLLWIGLGLWIVWKAPFGSGTDESVGYVALAAAKNRWATEDDFRRYGIDHFYYPPLYYLVFAPFWGDDPAFVENYPRGNSSDPNYLVLAGRRTVSADYLSRVPPSLLTLYRQAKLVSLLFGLVTILALAATLRLLYPGPAGWWIVLLGTAPLILLPQFLYYQTLVNSDTLLNALAALASFAFTAAILGLERGRELRFLLLSLAAAFCLGLAFLTKTSAPVLLPLPAGLVAAGWAADRGLARQRRIRRALRLSAMMAIATVISGGWWIGYKAWLGDWNSFKAHRLAHPWAAGATESLADPSWWADMIVQIVRSYYALFSGVLFIGVPDMVFTAWLIVPAAVLCCAVALTIARVVRRGQTRPAGSEHRLRRVVWLSFAGVVLLNGCSILANLFFFNAAYGRLLFPSLVALHALATAVIVRALRGGVRQLATAAVILVVHLALLFGWTFRQRLAGAVAQPPEDVRVLTGVETTWSLGSVWDFPMEQPLSLPAGDLIALHVGISRRNAVPQFGAALEGTLLLRSADGREQAIPVRRIALGDSDFSFAWPELALERTIRLAEETPALLMLQGSPPWWLPDLNQFRYQCCNTGLPARSQGALTPCTLCVAAVYDP